MDFSCRTITIAWLMLLGIAFLSSCEGLRRQPTKKDLDNSKSSTNIVNKQEEIKKHTEAIKKLAEESINQAIDIQDRSQGGWQIPSWIWWAGGIGLLAYLGLLPLVLGIGIKVVHNIAKGIKEVDYG